jgi:hypothetical protein
MKVKISEVRRMLEKILVARGVTGVDMKISKTDIWK